MKLLPEQVAKMRETLEQLKVQYQETVEEKASNARNAHIGTDGFDDINTSVNINNSANLTKAGLPVSLTLIIMAIIVILTDNTKQRFKNIV